MNYVGRRLAFNVLWGEGFASAPETDAADGRESEENAATCQLTVRILVDHHESLPERDTQSPDGLHLEASGLGGTNPVVVVHHAPAFIQAAT